MIKQSRIAQLQINFFLEREAVIFNQTKATVAKEGNLASNHQRGLSHKFVSLLLISLSNIQYSVAKVREIAFVYCNVLLLFLRMVSRNTYVLFFVFLPSL